MIANMSCHPKLVIFMLSVCLALVLFKFREQTASKIFKYVSSGIVGVDALIRFAYFYCQSACCRVARISGFYGYYKRLIIVHQNTSI